MTDHGRADDHGDDRISVEHPADVADGHDRGPGDQRDPAAEPVDHRSGDRREHHHGQADGHHRQTGGRRR